MKISTSIEQSRVLSKIISVDSADMGWYYSSDPYTARNQMWLGTNPKNADLPAWSLTKLLDIMPSECEDNHFLTLEKEGNEYCCCYDDVNGNSFTHEFADDPIDAVYKMILKLHENELL